MIYLKKYKRRKKKNYIVVIIALAIIFELFFFITNKLKSESNDSNTSVEGNIESAVTYVVGITRERGLLENRQSTWGSGVIVSKKGYVLTNSHVCGDKGSYCSISIDNDNNCKGVVIWSNSDLDLAIVKTNISFNRCITLGDSSNLRLGQNVYTIGNPINSSFQKSVGKGIISGLNRSLEFEEQKQKFYMTDLIQTDAVINYGNSGGALIDEAGNLIGICTIKISDAELMGFCVKINIAKPVIDKIEKNGEFDEIDIGMWCYDKYSIRETDIYSKIDNGLYVAKVDANSLAEKSGIRVGDVINCADTSKLQTVNDLKEIIFSRDNGENIILKISRDNKEVFVNLKLQNST